MAVTQFQARCPYTVSDQRIAPGASLGPGQTDPGGRVKVQRPGNQWQPLCVRLTCKLGEIQLARAFELALLPGSRGAEVEMLSADFLKTAQLLRQTYPDLEIVVPLVNAKRREQFERIKAEVAPDLSVHLLDGMGREAMVASDAALLASGTAALECMLAKCPMVVGYRMKPFTFWLAKRLVKTDYVSLPNLLAGRELVKELLQEECEPQKLAAALLPLLANGKTSHAMHDTFRELHQQIRCNADEQAAQAVLELAQ